MQQVEKNLKEFRDAYKLLNISAPMEYFAKNGIKESYLEIIQAAWNLTFNQSVAIPFEQGIRLCDAKHGIEAQLSQPVECKETRRFEVMPETIAPMISVSLDPLCEPGMYAVVDMGAATTEVSVFRLSERGFDQKILCYQDSTRVIGGNDLHRTDGGSSEAIERVKREVELQFCQTWERGFLIDAKNQHARRLWQKLKVLFSGGATLDERVESFLFQYNPKKQREDLGDLQKGGVVWKRNIPRDLSSKEIMSDDSLSFFAVANGLAIDEEHWPEMLRDIEPMEAPIIIEKPQSYWYNND
ncbi:MAG: hypothetical protein R3C18_26220 [Planctomycetaceae bacterium]